jgi:hypothetical protein
MANYSGYDDYQIYDNSRNNRLSNRNKCKKNKDYCPSSDDDCSDNCRPIVEICNPCVDKPYIPVWCPPADNSTDDTFGNVFANSFNAPPKRIYVPGDGFDILNNNYNWKFRNIQEALASLIPPSLGGPINGYQLILGPGNHRVNTNFSLEIPQLILTAYRYHGFTSMFYGHNIGHAQTIVPNIVDFYDKLTGGLGLFKLYTDGNRIEVRGGKYNGRVYNPDFTGLQVGQQIVWKDLDGNLTCFKVKCVECNKIWVNDFLPHENPKRDLEDGEGFFIDPLVNLQFIGSPSRILQLNGGNMEAHGLKLQTLANPSYCTDLYSNDSFLSFGVVAGSYLLKHCAMVSPTIGLGSYRAFYPNLFLNKYQLPSGGTGIMSYCTILAKLGSIIADRSSGSLLACAALNNLSSMEVTGSSGMSFLGSVGIRNTQCLFGRGSSINILGSRFLKNATGIKLNMSSFASINNEFLALNVFQPPFFNSNDKAMILENKSTGYLDTIALLANNVDLTLELTPYVNLASYVTGTPSNLISLLYYTTIV